MCEIFLIYLGKLYNELKYEYTNRKKCGLPKYFPHDFKVEIIETNIFTIHGHHFIIKHKQFHRQIQE